MISFVLSISRFFKEGIEFRSILLAFTQKLESLLFFPVSIWREIFSPYCKSLLLHFIDHLQACNLSDPPSFVSRVRHDPICESFLLLDPVRPSPQHGSRRCKSNTTRWPWPQPSVTQSILILIFFPYVPDCVPKRLRMDLIYVRLVDSEEELGIVISNCLKR